jgi:hypothetical protein
MKRNYRNQREDRAQEVSACPALVLVATGQDLFSRVQEAEPRQAEEWLGLWWMEAPPLRAVRGQSQLRLPSL